MPRPGWIKLYHSLLDNPMWTQTPFTEGQAWVDILLLVAHEPHDVSGDVWQPGQVRLSKAWLMRRWGWTRWRMDTTLKRWENEKMIQQHTNQRTNQRTAYTVITVEKWSFFQGGRSKNQHTNQHTNQQEHKNIYKKGGGGGKTPRPAGQKTDEYELVWDEEKEEWLQRRRT